MTHWIKKRIFLTKTLLNYTFVFAKVALSSQGLASPQGRILIWGKIRRILINLVPGLPEYLKKKNGVVGGCNRCGTSCRLLFQCPSWNEKVGCTVYNDRPKVCRTFPITPSDLKERDLLSPQTACGYFVRQEVKQAKEEKKFEPKSAQKHAIQAAVYPPSK